MISSSSKVDLYCSSESLDSSAERSSPAAIAHLLPVACAPATQDHLTCTAGPDVAKLGSTAGGVVVVCGGVSLAEV